MLAFIYCYASKTRKSELGKATAAHFSGRY